MTTLRKGIYWISLAILVSCLARAQEPTPDQGKSLGEIARAYRARKQAQNVAPVQKQAASAVFRRWSEMSPSSPAKFAGRPDNVKPELAQITPVIPASAPETADRPAAGPLVAVRASSPR